MIRIKDKLTPKQRLLAALIIVQFILAFKMYGQSIGVYQDPKLAIVGDNERGIDQVLATSIYFRLEGNEQTYGRMYLSPFVNFTNLKNNYWRYGVEGGYIWNTPVKNVEVFTGVGLGVINRFKGTYLSFNGSLGCWHDFGRIRAGAIAQMIDRSDLEARWNTGGFKFNLEIGLEVKL